MDPIALRSALDGYYREITSTIVRKQHPTTGLLPASTAVSNHGDYRDAWVRDNVYSSLAVWGLALAYRRLDDDGGRGFELEHRTIHLMRALLRSMMSQSAKVEAFKWSRRPQDALHAKYSTETGNPVVGDSEWGHLQLDATSLYLLVLAQMISSGLHIVWSTDEVNFVQNLIYYIERAYRTPDYGIWERGAKSNLGHTEINASSVGMAKAALEALSGFDLFGSKGSQASVVHVSPDNIALANITLSSMLPRESPSKETDAALLSIVGYPAYAVQPFALAEQTRRDVVEKLEGRYGLKRFLRDGHQTVVEDEHRLHYEPQELERFEHLESEWPLFFSYLYLDGILTGDEPRARRYAASLEHALVERDGQRLLPELYYVPHEAVDAERAAPGSQARVPNDNVPLVWAQSLFMLARMLDDELINANDIDPLGRRHKKLPRSPVVQVLLLAEDEELQEDLATHGVATETLSDIAPTSVYLPDDIIEAYAQVGKNEALGLTGRVARALKSLTTSRLYRLQGKLGVCLASFFLQKEFFLVYDMEFLVHRFESELSYLHQHWTYPGRPTVSVLLTHDLLSRDRAPFLRLVREIESGRVGSVPVKQGRLSNLTPTASVERIDNLEGIRASGTLVASTRRSPAALPEPRAQVPLTARSELAIEGIESVDPLVEKLAATHNLYEQVELLTTLARILPMDAALRVGEAETSLGDLVEEVYRQAGRLRLWAVVRRAAGLLGKVDGEVNLAVGAILVRQKMIQLGRAYREDSLIVQPLPDDELIAKIKAFGREDPRDRVLTQELLLYCSTLIKARPELFGELLTIRVGHLISLLSAQLALEQRLAAHEGYEALMHLSPSEIQARLGRVLSQYADIESLPRKLEKLRTRTDVSRLAWEPDLGFDRVQRPPSGWLSWRQHRGVIDRRPKNFYHNTWRIFHHVRGLVLGEQLDRRNLLDSSLVVSDMTSGEAAFALLLERQLNKFHAPEYRQLNIEALRVLSSFFGQNPNLRIDDVISLDAIIGHAVHLFYVELHPERRQDYSDHKAEAWAAFYEAAPTETSRCMVLALQTLLQMRTDRSSEHPRAS